MPPDATLRPRLHIVDSLRGPVATNLAAIVVNYNGWRDTAACIVSLLAGNVAPRWIHVADNASTDDSAERIASFLRGQEIVVPAQPLPFGGPRRLCIRDHDTALEVRLRPDDATQGAAAAGVSIVFDVADRNGGFAAGNNLGIRRLAGQGFRGYFWLVNSDAYVAPDCVQALVEAGQADGLPPIFGTVLVDHDRPDRVQACGSRIFGPSMKARSLCVGELLAALQRRGATQTASYPVGASLLFVSHRPDGLVVLNEEYFLYCEEPDLVRRFGVGSVPIYTRAVVAHKGGAATGGSAGHTLTTDYYSIRARILYAWTEGGWALAATTLHGALICVKRFFTGRPGFAINACKAVSDGLARRTGLRGA